MIKEEIKEREFPYISMINLGKGQILMNRNKNYIEVYQIQVKVPEVVVQRRLINLK